MSVNHFVLFNKWSAANAMHSFFEPGESSVHVYFSYLYVVVIDQFSYN